MAIQYQHELVLGHPPSSVDLINLKLISTVSGYVSGYASGNVKRRGMAESLTIKKVTTHQAKGRKHFDEEE